MKGRIWLQVVGATLLCACSPHAQLSNGAVVLEADVVLTRFPDQPFDTATRELAVADDSVLVAIVDENLTDVKLRLAVLGAGAAQTVEVENNLSGAGIELAMLSVPEGSRVLVTLTSAQDTVQPGTVHLRLRQFAADAARDPGFSGQLAAFGAWTAATDASLRTEAVRKSALADMQRAIDGLASAPADATLAAHARLIKARMLEYFRIDWREARAEAQRAASAFAALPIPDALGEARTRYIEALALIELSDDLAATDPTPDEARKLAREKLESLIAPESPFGSIERARAIGTLGQLELNMAHARESDERFEQARAMFAAAGHAAGEREMRWNLGMVLNESGRFAEAASAFDALLPDIEKIANPGLRTRAYLAAARGQSFAMRTDESAELLLKALALSREYQMRQHEASAVQFLGYHFQNRGDLLQARAFFDEALKLTRDGHDVMQYVWALLSAGWIARRDGDLERAFALDSEAVRRASTPIGQVRTRFALAHDHQLNDDYPSAIAEYRLALAVDLQDPRHHAYTDGKIVLTLCLLEHGPSTPKDLAYAERLIAEALETSARVKDDYRVIYSTRVEAQLLARLGRSAAALAAFDRTLTLAQKYRQHSTSTEVRASMMDDEVAALRGYLDIVLADVAKRGAGVFRPASARELAGLRRLERARYGSFGALRVGPLDAKSSARADELLEHMGQKSLRIATLLASERAAAEEAELRTLQFDMARLHTELDQTRASAGAQGQGAAQTSELGRGWRSLAPGSVQLSYALGEKHVYALVRSASGTRVAALAPARKDLEQQLGALSKLGVRSTPGEYETALEQVSAVLLPAGVLPEKSSSVEIVAEGRIASVPFPALRSPTDPRRRLIETHDIAMVTSLLEVEETPRLRHARPYRFVALASGSGTWRAAPVVDPIPRLQAAIKEIGVAAKLFTEQDPSAKIKLFTGTDGTAGALRDIWVSGADVVHFATHALADLRQPIASLLVLPATDTNGNSTYLTAGQVQGWHGDAELVFLSACESAVGPPQYAAGMPGLQRAFLRAGARGVIATLAPIEDVLAQQFAEDFYARYTSGQSAVRALTETQRAWLAPRPQSNAEEQLRRRLTALSHAYYAN